MTYCDICGSILDAAHRTMCVECFGVGQRAGNADARKAELADEVARQCKDYSYTPATLRDWLRRYEEIK